MERNFTVEDINDGLSTLAKHLVNVGDEVGSRNGRVMEMMHTGITVEKPWQREMLLPERKSNIAAQIAETMWVLAGRNDIEFLSHYLPRAADFSDDGETWRAGYGPRLRKWQWEMTSTGKGADQLAEVVRLLRQDPLTRRAVMSIFDPGADYASSKDIPCNNWLSFSNRLGKLDLHVAIRSNDLIWGWSGINYFEWSALQEIVAGLVGVGVGRLHFSTTSLHVYEQHWGKARDLGDSVWPEDIADSVRFALPYSEHHADPVAHLDDLIEWWFRLEYDIRTGSPLVDGYIQEFPEPMMRSWLYVLQWWWSGGDTSYLQPIAGTRLGAAALVAMQPKRQQPRWMKSDVSEFYGEATALHAEKSAAYGDSWKKRGELFSVIPNIARKVDRLGGAETADETSADTAMDLLIYLVKYRWWLSEHATAPLPLTPPGNDGLPVRPLDERNDLVDLLLHKVEHDDVNGGLNYGDHIALTEWLREIFDSPFGLADQASDQNPDRFTTVDDMLPRAYRLARALWQNSHVKKANATRAWNPEPLLAEKEDQS